MLKEWFGDECQEEIKPSHIPDQRALLADALTSDRETWVIVLDGGRYDFFDQLVGGYFEGDLRRTWNGGVGFTGDWFARNCEGDYPGRGLFSYSPIWEYPDTTYDEREHFGTVVDVGRDETPESRLAALGYLDGESVEVQGTNRGVNAAVRKSDVNGGLIRYLDPHTPWPDLPELTEGNGLAGRVQAALDSGEVTHAELTDAYESAYRDAFRAASDLYGDLTGRVILTSDHGTCLTCGQLFHGRQLDKHDHLCVVPWMEVYRRV